jgi:hypothetical protein
MVTDTHLEEHRAALTGHRVRIPAKVNTDPSES